MRRIMRLSWTQDVYKYYFHLEDVNSLIDGTAIADQRERFKRGISMLKRYRVRDYDFILIF